MSLGDTLPASWYRDPDVYRAERTAVFARTWQLVARARDLAEPGSSLHIELAGFPVVIVRPDDGGDGGGPLRAFHDVCAHRGGPLSCAGSSLVCGYHGWTYDLDGHLVRARDFGGDVPDGVALRPVDVDEWRGFVFVRLNAGDDADAGPSLVDDLGSFADAVADFPMESFRFDGEVVHDLRTNWKTYADNYLEGYHIPVVHPELDATIDSRRYEVDVDEVGRWARHRAPARDGSATSGVWLWRHPNLALNVYPDGMNVERFLPVGHDRTLVVYWYFFAADADRADIESSRKLSMSLMDEDRAICEAVQRNLDAGIYERGPLSPRHEAGLAAFQRWVREAVEG